MKKMTPLKIVIIYIISSQLWILLSDLIVSKASQSQDMFTKLSIIKGWLYVATIGLLLYWLLSRFGAERDRAEKSLRLSEQSYKMLSQNLPGIVYRVYTRENNRMQFFNKAAEEITGCSDTELSQGAVCSLEELIIDEDRQKVVAVVQNAIAEHRPFTIEYRLNSKDGSIKFLIEKGTPIYASDEQILYIDGVIFDISEQKRMEEERIERISAERAMNNVLMEIHDGIGGITTNITMLSEVAKKAIRPEDAEKALNTISDLARDGMVEIRSLMYSLDREDLGWRSLVIEMRNQGIKLLEPHAITLTMTSEIEDNIQNPGSHLCLNLFRIYREALMNVIKHAKATKVMASFHVNEERLVLVIQDDGKGFQQSALAGSGRGVGNMMARAAAMQGRVAITGDRGTCVTIEIPIMLKNRFQSSFTPSIIGNVDKKTEDRSQ
jgi:PAS domain S-box-containing protein